jgi:hypothetical protein
MVSANCSDFWSRFSPDTQELAVGDLNKLKDDAARGPRYPAGKMPAPLPMLDKVVALAL